MTSRQPATVFRSVSNELVLQQFESTVDRPIEPDCFDSRYARPPERHRQVDDKDRGGEAGGASVQMMIEVASSIVKDQLGLP